MRQRPTLPGRLQPSTIGVLRLNFCVRNGNRWNPQAITTASGEQDRGGRSVSVLPFRTLFSAESSSYLSVWHFLSGFLLFSSPPSFELPVFRLSTLFELLAFRPSTLLSFLPFGFLALSSFLHFCFPLFFRALCLSTSCSFFGPSAFPLLPFQVSGVSAFHPFRTSCISALCPSDASLLPAFLSSGWLPLPSYFKALRFSVLPLSSFPGFFPASALSSFFGLPAPLLSKSHGCFPCILTTAYEIYSRSISLPFPIGLC